MQGKGNEYFAEWLTRTLAEREIPGGDVARAIGVNDSAVSRWKNGRASPGLDSVMKLASYLKIDPPIRLAVTAGLIKECEAGVTRLSLPEDIKTRSIVRDQIMGIRGLTRKEREKLMETYEDMSREVRVV